MMDITGKEIRQVFLKEYSREFYNSIVFVFDDSSSLIVSVEANTDELIFELGKVNEDHKAFVIPAWSNRIVNKKIVAQWISKNQLGYADLFVMGIGEFVPTMAISSISSQLEIRFCVKEQN